MQKKKSVHTNAISLLNVYKRNLFKPFRLLRRRACLFQFDKFFSLKHFSIVHSVDVISVGLKGGERNKLFFDDNIKIEIPLESIEKIICAVLNTST